jgi:hypothetical protein
MRMRKYPVCATCVQRVCPCAPVCTVCFPGEQRYRGSRVTFYPRDFTVTVLYSPGVVRWWVWMADVRFVCVIRVPVCPVCVPAPPGVFLPVPGTSNTTRGRNCSKK